MSSKSSRQQLVKVCLTRHNPQDSTLTLSQKLRATAHKEQLSMKTAVLESSLPAWQKETYLVCSTPSSPSRTFLSKLKPFHPQNHPKGSTSHHRNHASKGREPDVFVNRRGYLSLGGVCLDDGFEDAELDFALASPSQPTRSSSPMVISLADVKTTVAKPKGVRKEYDWVERINPVLVLDDDVRSAFDDDEWEEIQREQEELFSRVQKPSWSQVVTEGTRGG